MKTLFKPIFDFVTSKLTYILIGLGLLALVIILIQCGRINHFKDEDSRQDANVQNLLQGNDKIVQELTLTRKEYADADTKWKHEIDSVVRVSKDKDIQINRLQEALLFAIQYEDTGTVHAHNGTPVIINTPGTANAVNTYISYTIPVSFDSLCWGMEGKIFSKDPDSKLDITRRSFSNTAEIFITKERRFLGFLWVTKKPEYKAFNNCGVIRFTSVKFIKK